MCPFFSKSAIMPQYGSGTCFLILISLSTTKARVGPCTLPMDKLWYRLPLLATLNDCERALERFTPYMKSSICLDLPASAKPLLGFSKLPNDSLIFCSVSVENLECSYLSYLNLQAY